MRTGHNKQRSRNRHRSSGGGGGGGGGGGNPLSRVYESNGPDVKVRGTAQTVADKYLQLGRDAQVSGDNVMAESYYQFAEHYLRIVAAAQAYNQQVQAQYRRPDEDQDDDGDDESGDVPGAQPRLAPQHMGEQPTLAADQGRDGDVERGQQNYVPRQQRDQRDSQGQSYGNRDRDRDRNRSRWQDRRDQPQGNQGDGRTAPPSRADDQPREMPAAAAPTKPADTEDSGQWEAPSFLRRPATLAPVAAPVVETEPVAAAEPAPAPERKPRRTRREKPAVETPQPAAETAD
ncbi:MAG: DUF4167 domain-containing protein [Alphaproteobacteria bacterium]|nr:DUF4167 domain-containing protein [Alphaproteobacteria bacterium]